MVPDWDDSDVTARAKHRRMRLPPPEGTGHGLAPGPDVTVHRVSGLAGRPARDLHQCEGGNPPHCKSSRALLLVAGASAREVGGRARAAVSSTQRRQLRSCVRSAIVQGTLRAQSSTGGAPRPDLVLESKAADAPGRPAVHFTASGLRLTQRSRRHYRCQRGASVGDNREPAWAHPEPRASRYG
jgi:hypothetical protein